MSVLDFLRGFTIPLRQVFRPKLTDFYPKEKSPKPERLHGRHVLNRYEDGMEKCIGCELCAGVCPARCIYVRGADNPPDAPVSPGERYGFVYEGTFRQHMIAKGRNRDDAWFSILDSEWPARGAGFERWLAPDNFDAEGRQKMSLNALNSLAAC